jgi:hypothetical protein
MTPEEMQAGEILPQVGEVAAHIGRQYECTSVEWDREDDEIVVTYRRRYADSHGEPLPDPFKRGFLGMSTTAMIFDEAATWRDASVYEFPKRDNPPEWGNRDGG